MNLKSILAIPRAYQLFQDLIRGKSLSSFVQAYLRPFPHVKILDIGCGPANILEHLPLDAVYTGFDVSPQYIAAAKKRFAHRGTFFCKAVGIDVIPADQSFDIVLAKGVLHHLNDTEALALFQLAHRVLAPHGRLVTIDGCYVEKQSAIARFLLSQDRGEYVRSKQAYLDLASQFFPSIKAEICHDRLRVPYTHIIMECSPHSNHKSA